MSSSTLFASFNTGRSKKRRSSDELDAGSRQRRELDNNRSALLDRDGREPKLMDREAALRSLESTIQTRETKALSDAFGSRASGPPRVALENLSITHEGKAEFLRRPETLKGIQALVWVGDDSDYTTGILTEGAKRSAVNCRLTIDFGKQGNPLIRIRVNRSVNGKSFINGKDETPVMSATITWHPGVLEDPTVSPPVYSIDYAECYAFDDEENVDYAIKSEEVIKTNIPDQIKQLTESERSRLVLLNFRAGQGRSSGLRGLSLQFSHTS